MPFNSDDQNLCGALRQACDELERRVRGGGGRAEDVLAEWPAVAADPEAALELIYTEFVLRQERGERPAPEEWFARFPDRRADLTQLFQVDGLARAGLSDTQPGGGPVPEAAPRGDIAGRRVGHYELLEEVGRGAMGVIYKARQEGFNRLVALKLVLGGEHADGKALARFRREAETVGSLSHPNVVQVFEVGEHEGRPFFSMELVEGSLEKRLAAGPLPPRPAAALLETLARAVQAAHEAGVVHRDLKPANVLLAGSPEGPIDRCVPKVGDFGLAKWLQETAGAKGEGWRTETGAIVGTPSYMAPEQAGWRGQEVGPAADVWALGAILYECLTGRAPFLAAGVMETLLLVREEEPAPVRLLNPQVPRDLETVCLMCLRKEARKRYASAVDLAEDLRRWQAGEPIEARPVGAAERAWKWARRRPAVAILLGVVASLAVAIVVGVAAAFWALGNEQAKTAGKREEAEKNLEEAIAAVDECFGLAKDDPLLQGEQLRKVRKVLLEKTLPFYRGFARRSLGDPGLAERQAEYLYRVALITSEIGSKGEALQACEEALEVQRRLVQGAPEVSRYQAALARSHHSLGLLQSETGKPQEAAASYARAKKLLEGLLEVHPKEAEYQAALARNYRDVGRLHVQSGERHEGLQSWEQAGEIQRRLTEEYPKDSQHWADLALTWRNRGVLHARAGNTKEAVASYDRAREIQRRLTEEQPGVTQYRADLALTWNNLASLQGKMGIETEALTSYAQAKDILQRLAQAHPEVTSYSFDLARTCFNMGHEQARAGKSQEATNSYEQAKMILTPLSKRHPEVTDYQITLAATCNNLGDLFIHGNQALQSLRLFAEAIQRLQGVRRREPDHAFARQCLLKSYLSRAQALGLLERHAEALLACDQAERLAGKDAARLGLAEFRASSLAKAGEYRQAMSKLDELAKDKAVNAASLYNLACTASLAAASVSRERGRPLPEREKQAETWARQAIELLRRSADAGLFRGPTYLDHLRKDPDLAFLRDRDDFRRWLAGLGK